VRNFRKPGASGHIDSISFDTMFYATSYQHSHYSSLHAILSTALPWVRVRFATPDLMSPVERRPTKPSSVFGARLKSRVSSAPLSSSGTLLRDYSSVAASKPTNQLSSENDHLSHFALSLGPYTSVWAVSLSTNGTCLPLSDFWLFI